MNDSVPVGSRGSIFRLSVKKIRRRHTESERKTDPKWGKKGKREIQERSTNFCIFLLLARARAMLFFSFYHSSSLSRHPCLGGFVRPSSSLTPNLGVVADSGGGRVRMVVAMVGG